MSDKTVKVGCRVPNGLRLQVSDWIKGPDGNPLLKVMEIYDIAGSGVHLGQMNGNIHPENDATYTEIPADHWNKWYEMNKDSDLVKSGAIFKGGARAKVEEAGVADPVQAEAEAQRTMLGEPESPDPKTDAEVGKRAAKTAKTI